MSKTLLPPGCYDLLPPHARHESELSSVLLSVFESFGYEQVAPPLLEYSDNLLAGRGAALSQQIFRVMDPSAHKVMGIRADITLQIARIATGRLSASPRPLRLCYNGLILRMQSEQLKSDRQLRQAGIELIGAGSPDADAEVILVAAQALEKAGIKEISIDLNLPGIVGSLLASEKMESSDLAKLFEAIAHKDISTIKNFSFAHRDTLIALLLSAGPADSAFAAIDKLSLPEAARAQYADLKDVLRIVKTAGRKNWHFTVDAAESRCIDYHSGISFSIFVPGAACEVGRGGRYQIENGGRSEDAQATGFTLYVETLRSVLPEIARQKRIFIPDGIAKEDTSNLRTQGFVTVHALSEYGNDAEEAKRLGCGFIWKNQKIEVL